MNLSAEPHQAFVDFCRCESLFQNLFSTIRTDPNENERIGRRQIGHRSQ